MTLPLIAQYPVQTIHPVENELVTLDLRYQHWRKVDGDITLILTWNWGLDSPDACLCLAPTAWDLEADGEPTVCVIDRDDAWRWSRTHNNDRHMIGHWGFNRPPSSDWWQMATATYYADQLGLAAHEPRTVNRIRGLIEDHLDELIKCPPAPTREGMKTAVFTVTDLETGRESEVEIALA